MSCILVICEINDGKIRKPSLEALSAGRKLSVASSLPLVAFAGGDAASLAAAAGAAGVTKLYVVPNAELGAYHYEHFVAAAQQLIAELKPAVVLAGGTANGRDLAPRLAARLGVGVASDVDRLDWVGGKLQARRPVYAGRAFATVELEGSPAIATTRSNAFPVEQTEGGAAAEVVTVAWQPSATMTQLVESKTPEAGEISVAEADIIVSGGRGLKEATNFSYVRDLAHALGAAVGASRATVDAGWIDHQHQVGQTGRVVGPNLYIAAGISGAIQHLAGMSASKHIVAINKDPEAPIFRIADLGIVGDLFTILPALTEAVKAEKEKH